MTGRYFRLALAPFLLLVWGCAGYRLGSTLPPDVRGVYVPTIENHTGEPDLTSTLTRAVQQEFQRDGTLSLRDMDTADAIVRIQLHSFRLDSALYSRDDVRRVAEYRLTLGAEVIFVRRDSGEVLYNGIVMGDTTFAAPADLTAARNAALVPAARSLAREIVGAVISAW